MQDSVPWCIHSGECIHSQSRGTTSFLTNGLTDWTEKYCISISAKGIQYQHITIPTSLRTTTPTYHNDGLCTVLHNYIVQWVDSSTLQDTLDGQLRTAVTVIASERRVAGGLQSTTKKSAYRTQYMSWNMQCFILLRSCMSIVSNITECKIDAFVNSRWAKIYQNVTQVLTKICQ